jgi:hypothetical protein
MVALRRGTAVMKAASIRLDQERDHCREQEDADSGARELAPENCDDPGRQRQSSDPPGPDSLRRRNSERR